MSGFSDGERERIREALIHTGREKFTRYGVKKTTIGDLTEPVGIASGTFYRFFDSKDDLYWAVLETEREGVVERIETAVSAAAGPEAEIRALLSAIFSEIETNPLVRGLLDDADERARMIATMSEAELEAAHREKVAFLLPHVESWIDAGVEFEGEPEVVAGALRSLAFLTLHEVEIGPDYPEIRDLLIASVAAGLAPGDHEN
ncbi:TetR/AcrR family transcriptional regulator [Natronorarus salvus]|uniref:TetR/AcrR family transcriptional regulator n=1 Tax=Natronorarus salvus TaxID=3117733 RepID=UPI002F260D89